VGKLDLGQRLMRLLPGRAAPRQADASEAVLVERLRRGEPLAIDQLYRAQHTALRAYAQRLIGDTAAAEDLVHDVFVRLPDLLAQYRAESSLRTFLFGVATRLSQQYVTRGIRRRRLLAQYAPKAELDAHTPEQRLAEAERLQQLHALLDVLPLAQRAAFVLCELEERTAREAAEILSVPEATVRTRCFHARKRLQESLSRRLP
jgi:RNA polymerase sigma-70 factor (ECF subfamily)